MIKESRKHKRFNVKISLLGQLLRKGRRITLTEKIPVLSKDISLGGIRLRWPKGWKCNRCTNCLGWVFNFGCRFKNNSNNRINRTLDQEVIIRLILKVKDDKPQEILARIIWVEEPQDKQEHYDVGFNFIKVSKEAEQSISSLIK